MDIENVRKKLNISGYVHPSNTNAGVVGNSRYKTFTEGGKKIKDMNEAKSIEIGQQYAIHNTENINSCPVCQQEAIRTCPCAYSDKICSNNHYWYTDRKGEDKIGNPHKMN